MPESVKNSISLVEELTEARVIQAIMAIILTIGVMVMYLLEIPISTELSSIWLLIIGLYLELPAKRKNTA